MTHSRLIMMNILTLALVFLGGCHRSPEAQREAPKVEISLGESESGIKAEILAVSEPKSVIFMRGGQTSVPSGQKWLVINVELKASEKSSFHRGA